MKKTIYVVLESFNGNVPDDVPEVVYAFTNLKKAIAAFEYMISARRPEHTNFEESKHVDENGFILYNMTDFEEDYHLYIKLEKVELNDNLFRNIS
jgi:hypothetical protein